jgi:hypothetical protein
MAFVTVDMLATLLQIQSVVLMFLGKRRSHRKRKELAALAIQRLWRGVVGRGLADRCDMSLSGIAQREPVVVLTRVGLPPGCGWTAL